MRADLCKTFSEKSFRHRRGDGRKKKEKKEKKDIAVGHVTNLSLKNEPRSRV